MRLKILMPKGSVKKTFLCAFLSIRRKINASIPMKGMPLNGKDMMINKMCGIYIHIPFCRRKCIYCDFYSVCYDKELSGSFVTALNKSIENRADKKIKVDTIYFGGGTPTALESRELVSVLNTVKNSFDVSNDAEITVEANPCTVTDESLSELFCGGFNRISFGIQSAVNGELSALSRLHTFEQAKEAVLNAEKAGFSNISADIMIGIINQTNESLVESIEKITALPVKHISAYMLKIEENTPLDAIIKKNSDILKSIADEDALSDRYLLMCDLLEQKGFSQYEISNFAKPGFESRHNLKYWRCEEYLGFGPHAHSYFNNKRYFEDCDVIRFIEHNGESQLTYTDTDIDKAEEYIMLSLRLKNGLDIDRLLSLDIKGRYKNIVSDAMKINRLSKERLINISEDKKNISLTKKGFLVSNTVIAKLLGN